MKNILIILALFFSMIGSAQSVNSVNEYAQHCCKDLAILSKSLVKQCGVFASKFNAGDHASICGELSAKEYVARCCNLTDEDELCKKFEARVPVHKQLCLNVQIKATKEDLLTRKAQLEARKAAVEAKKLELQKRLDAMLIKSPMEYLDLCCVKDVDPANKARCDASRDLHKNRASICERRVSGGFR